MTIAQYERAHDIRCKIDKYNAIIETIAEIHEAGQNAIFPALLVANVMDVSLDNPQIQLTHDELEIITNVFIREKIKLETEFANL